MNYPHPRSTGEAVVDILSDNRWRSPDQILDDLADRGRRSTPGGLGNVLKKLRSVGLIQTRGGKWMRAEIATKRKIPKGWGNRRKGLGGSPKGQPFPRRRRDEAANAGSRPLLGNKSAVKMRRWRGRRQADAEKALRDGEAQAAYLAELRTGYAACGGSRYMNR